MRNKRISTRALTEAGLLLGIMLMMNWTKIGYLPIGPIYATTMHIPVIIGAVLRGPGMGGVLGLCFGLTSWIQALQGTSGPTAFIFMNPLVSIVPRVLMGVFTGMISRAFDKHSEKGIFRFAVAFWAITSVIMAGYVVFSIKKGTGVVTAAALLVFVLATAAATLIYERGKYVSISFAAAIGAMTNTILVMGLIYLIYAEQYMIAIGLSPDQALATVVSVCLINGIPEVILSVVITTPVGVAMRKRGKGH